ncbi:hypothetical protein [Aureibacter tunicatorum]|uniref:Long-chain fatty acid transport protein n=1 Tax=Aureibacter tunicatorum TaxID=866807 RepID=A0AAE4BRG6_9BACT|nr:hypothetical protein [Aureibacter tunicatorum]MDR6237775.1 hypothetical protein [Aureibacter tunicatorum]BDD02810.1 membrane protein [Aureibacter tunicatorum]
MSIKKNKFSLVVLLTLFLSSAYGQYNLSPYSVAGIGTLNNSGLAFNESMGGIGISNGSSRHANVINPALLPYNNYAVFDFGMIYENKTISGNNQKQNNGFANLAYLTAALPIKANKMGLSFGIMPYTTVNYKAENVSRFAGPNNEPIEQTSIMEGRGGVSKAFLGLGYRLSKNFSVGVEGVLYFGSINRDISTSLFDLRDPSTTPDYITFPYITSYIDQVTVQHVSVNFGLSYHANVGKNNVLNMGAIYELGGDYGGKRDMRLERRLKNNSGAPPEIERSITNESISQYIPSKYGFGASYEKPNKWLIGLDFTAQDWGKFKNSSGVNRYSGDTYKIALGGQWIPDIFSVNSYLSRVAYRFGAYYEKPPYAIENAVFHSWGFTGGFGFPVGASQLDIGFKYGELLVDKNSLYDEQTFQINIGFAFGGRDWFIKRKYD